MQGLQVEGQVRQVLVTADGHKAILNSAEKLGQ